MLASEIYRCLKNFTPLLMLLNEKVFALFLLMLLNEKVLLCSFSVIILKGSNVFCSASNG